MAAMSMRSLRIVVVLLGVFYQPSQGQVQEPNCGIRGTARILGGSNVKTSWPWQVQVLKLDTSHIGYEHKCGGVLLNKRYVLTTAGCLFQDPYPTFYKVKVGEYDLSKPDPGEEAIAVDSLIINREVFASDDRSNDIALIKLSEDVRYGSTVSPVCLPERMTRVKPGQKCYMTGWGRKSKNSPFSNILQEVVLPVVDTGKCAAKNKHLGKVDRWTMICAGYDDKATSGCYGDSGSPLVCEENGRWVVRGLASWGDPNCDGRRAYPVFTRVQQYMHWIMFGMIFPQRPYPSQVQEPNCGIRGTARILGGSNVKTSWPWQVQVLKLDTSHIGYEHKCGGVLLNKRYVLTTAGCLFQDPYPTFYKVKVGEYDLSKPDPGEEAIAVDSLIINREVFASDDRSNDIALIKLSEDVRYGSTVSPVCLPERMTRVKPGQKCYMTGWGRKSKNSPFSNILQEVVLPVVDTGKCAAKNKHLGKVDRWTMICAGYDDKATSGCYGDSGSPLVCEENGRWVVRGLASWGDPNCDGRRAYPVFTRVQQYMHWIMFGMIFPQRPYPRCRDNHWSCSYWHRKGLCNDDYFKHSLRKYCPETCGHCKET